MANKTNLNPIIIDTFSSDVTISTSPITVKKMLFWSTAADDKLALDDIEGNVVIYYPLATAKDTRPIDFGDEGFTFNGLVLDVSDGTYTTGSRLLIFLK